MPQHPALTQALRQGAMKPEMAQQWPELAKQWTREEIRKPELTAATGKVREMNWLENLIYGDKAYAITWPWGTIAMNRPQIETQGQNINDVLVHELEHIKQKKAKDIPYLPGVGALRTMWDSIMADKDYLKRPYEMEAIEAETKNMMPGQKPSYKDIFLPAEKKR